MRKNRDKERSSPIGELKGLFRDALKLSLDLFKIMVPVIIVVKILKELDLITYLAIPLSPLMKAVGLPAEMGLVWATAMLNNLYGAMVVLLSLVKDVPISTAQVTVLCAMMLVAHALPIELKIAQLSGPRLMFQAFCRLGSALLLGWMLHIFYSRLGLLQQPVDIIFRPDDKILSHKESLASWAAGEAQNLLFIFFIILGLFLLMRILKKLRIIDAMNRMLSPVLKLMGIGPKASAITVIGLTLGISYGGGLIIHEARSGRAHKKDVFYSLTLMGLSHALIEDTLLMVMLGGRLSGVLWARLAFSLLAVTLLVQISARLPAGFCDRFLWGPPK
ncbi:MAG: hypothetical protein GY849_01285 [Deltaproteobacteria bacterium]|nr:hypothetical protein [Deltaproteobacteria bacterium]